MKRQAYGFRDHEFFKLKILAHTSNKIRSSRMSQKIVRFGVPPLRIEIHTSISGVEFESCFANRVAAIIDGIDVPLIALADLRTNKKASGRHKDLADLEHLPDS